MRTLQRLNHHPRNERINHLLSQVDELNRVVLLQKVAIYVLTSAMIPLAVAGGIVLVQLCK